MRPLGWGDRSFLASIHIILPRFARIPMTRSAASEVCWSCASTPTARPPSESTERATFMTSGCRSNQQLQWIASFNGLELNTWPLTMKYIMNRSRLPTGASPLPRGTLSFASSFEQSQLHCSMRSGLWRCGCGTPRKPTA